MFTTMYEHEHSRGYGYEYLYVRGTMGREVSYGFMYLTTVTKIAGTRLVPDDI